MKWTGVAAMAAAVLFGGWAMELGRRVKLLEREVEAWASRYEADFRWLRSAESLLVHEVGPKLTARLAPPGLGKDAAPPRGEEAGGADRSPRGKAAAYDTYDERTYLLVALEGLEAGTRYEIWLAAGDAATRIGTVTAQAEGAAFFVYPGDRREEWTAVSVRREGQVVLAGAPAPAGGGEGR